VNEIQEPPVAAHGLVPHPPLTRYYADESERRRWLRGMFDRTALDYDRIEWLMTLGTGVRYRREALERAGLKPGLRTLDVGSGTGLTAVAAEAIVGGTDRVLRIDPSLGMLTSGRGVRGAAAIAGCAESLPVTSSHWDFVSMGFALRHVADLGAAFAEFHRVLRPGGRLCVLEITRPHSPIGRRFLKLYMRRWIPFVATMVGRTSEMPGLMRYYWDSTEASVPPATVVAALRDAGFTDAGRNLHMGIFSEYTATKSG
jgi:demethylmenaquinone methyltransferase / 2-methoxy-6-polyprenyl-1,4-benzoquinol methylase